MNRSKVILVLFILFAFLSCCTGGTRKGTVHNKYFWEEHIETWRHKSRRYQRAYDASYVIVIIRKDRTQMITVAKDIYDSVQEGDSMHFMHKGIIHNGSEPINSPYVLLSSDIRGRPHYYRRYWPRRCCGSRG